VAIIDQKGRLFGKINVLDLAILLVILAVAGLFGYKSLTKTAPAGITKVVEAQFLLNQVSKPTVDFLRPGVQVFDSKSNAYMGKITAAESKPALIINGGREFISEYKLDLTITVEGEGRVTPNGTSMGGIDLKGGRLYELRTAEWAFQPVLVSVPKVE